jgi:hypothetical protein
MSTMILRWSTSKIVFSDPDLGPKWTMYVCWRWPFWMEVGVTGHNFESWPPKDHSCHVCFILTYWFQRRRLLNIFSIASYVKIKSSLNFRCQIENQVSDYRLLVASSFLKSQNRFEPSLAEMFIGKISQKNPEYLLNYWLPCSCS